MFGRINPKQMEVEAKAVKQEDAAVLQYDYMFAYLEFFSPAGPQKALQIAKKYLNYPVLKKRKLFAEIADTIYESEPGSQPEHVIGKEGESRDKEMANLAATEPSVDFTVEAKRIAITYANLSKLTVNFYEMDVELMFSSTPFLGDGSANAKFVVVAPNHSLPFDELKQLPGKTNLVTVDLPAKYHNSNVYIEIVGPGQGLSRTQTYYSHSLGVQLIENYGQLKVTHKDTGAPLPQTYIKVYARMNSGEVSFYKDGYTDRRGRFDYASLSIDKLASVFKFSLLILSETSGAVVCEVNKPTE